MDKKQHYISGLRAGAPVILGFVPVGIAYAIMAQQAGLGILETILMSVTVFAGASQIMAVGMYAQGASLFAIILATFILNLRHLIMSTCVINRIKQSSLAMKLLLAFGVTDESFAIFSMQVDKQATAWFFFGLVTITYAAWVAGAIIGTIVTQFLPAIVTASLGIALYALFLGLLMPGVKRNLRLGILVILTAAINLILSKIISSSWALIVSALLGAGIGVFFVELEDTQEQEEERHE